MKTINCCVFFIFALTITVSSCKKDESNPEVILSTSERMKATLTEGSWTKSFLKLNGDSVALQECEKDDVYTFLKDGTVLYHVDAVICGGETDGSGTWSLSIDGKTLTLDGIPWSIEINKGRLTLSMYHFDDDSIDQTVFVAS
jgi:hypothetical protein